MSLVDDKKCWRRLKVWPANGAAKALGLGLWRLDEKGGDVFVPWNRQVAICRRLFEERVVLEVLRTDLRGQAVPPTGRETRIPASKGYDSRRMKAEPQWCLTPHLFPASDDRWGAVVEGKWYGRLLKVLGRAGRLPGGSEGTVYLPAERLQNAMELLKPRRRPRGNPNPDTAGIMKARKAERKAAQRV